MKKRLFFIWLILAIPIFTLTLYYNGSLFMVKGQKKSETNTNQQSAPTPTTAESKQEITLESSPISTSQAINNDLEETKSSKTNTPQPPTQPTNTNITILRETPRSINNQLPTSNITTPIPTPLQTSVPETTFVQIENLGNFQVNLDGNDTAFSILQKASQENNFSLAYQDYGSLGALIKCIGTICNANNYYWTLYYNNSFSTLGASSLKVFNKDKTSWRFEQH